MCRGDPTSHVGFSMFERGAVGDLSAVGVPEVVGEYAVCVAARAAWRGGDGRG